jgi:hypothetical protein
MLLTSLNANNFLYASKLVALASVLSLLNFLSDEIDDFLNYSEWNF